MDIQQEWLKGNLTDYESSVPSISCQGLFNKLVGGWFCDDECKKNAGYRVGGGQKRRRRG